MAELQLESACRLTKSPSEPAFMTTVAAESHDLVSELCQHFSQIAGWRLGFTPPHRVPGEIGEELEKRENCAWFAEISDGSRTAGFLHLDEPEPSEGERNRGNIVEVLALAESLAQVLGRLARAASQL